jgi:hypothetical protein
METGYDRWQSIHEVRGLRPHGVCTKVEGRCDGVADCTDGGGVTA